MKKLTTEKSIVEILDNTSRYSRDTIEKRLWNEIDEGKLKKGELAKIFEKHSHLIHSLNHPQTNAMALMLFEEKYRPMLQEMIGGIIRDYQCKGPVEVTLAQNISTAYVRTLVLQSQLNAYLFSEGLLSTLRNTRLQILSKELDRANRQYLMFTKTLTELKRPQLKVNVKIDSMVVGNNYVYPKEKFYD